MSLNVMPDVIQGTDDWHDQRRGMVTASVVGQIITARRNTAADHTCPECAANPGDPCIGKGAAAIKTMHPARADAARNSDTPPRLVSAATDHSRALVAQLAAERITGWTELGYIADEMLRGWDDEPRAVNVYADHTGAHITHVGFMVRDDWGFPIGYSPDGLVGDDGLLEVKSRRPKIHLQTILDGKVPDENMAQLQCGLLVSGRAWIDYLSYCGGMPLYTIRVEPDPRWQTAIVAAARDLEAVAADMIGTYTARVAGLPMTERITETDIIL